MFVVFLVLQVYDFLEFQPNIPAGTSSNVDIPDAVGAEEQNSTYKVCSNTLCNKGLYKHLALNSDETKKNHILMHNLYS